MRWALIACLMLSGCGLQRGRISAGGTTVLGVKDAGKAATLATVNDHDTQDIPAGTKVTVTESAAIPATEKNAFVPAQKVTAFDFSQPTRFEQVRVAVNADTGTVDTSIAKHRIDVESSKWLLWASIGCVPIAIFLFYIKYPTPAMYAGIASVIFFMAWKVADLPSWFYVAGVVALAVAFAAWRFHERGLKNAESRGMLPDTPDSPKTIVSPVTQNPTVIVP